MEEQLNSDLPPHARPNDVELSIVTMRFDAADAAALLAVLSK